MNAVFSLAPLLTIYSLIDGEQQGNVSLLKHLTATVLTNQHAYLYILFSKVIYYITDSETPQAGVRIDVNVRELLSYARLKMLCVHMTGTISKCLTSGSVQLLVFTVSIKELTKCLTRPRRTLATSLLGEPGQMQLNV